MCAGVRVRVCAFLRVESVGGGGGGGMGHRGAVWGFCASQRAPFFFSSLCARPGFYSGGQRASACTSLPLNPGVLRRIHTHTQKTLHSPPLLPVFISSSVFPLFLPSIHPPPAPPLAIRIWLSRRSSSVRAASRWASDAGWPACPAVAKGPPRAGRGPSRSPACSAL